MFWRIYEPLAYIAYVVGFAFVVGRVFWYFYQWDLATWKWIVAIVILPLTTIVMPFFIGFAEGDWTTGITRGLPPSPTCPADRCAPVDVCRLPSPGRG